MIPRRCHRCYRPVWVWPWQAAVCRDFERCIDEMRLILIMLDDQIEPPGPRWIEAPPDDIEKCSRCSGFGAMLRLDWESGPVYVDCPRCETTGKDPSLCPA